MGSLNAAKSQGDQLRQGQQLSSGWCVDMATSHHAARSQADGHTHTSWKGTSSSDTTSAPRVSRTSASDYFRFLPSNVKTPCKTASFHLTQTAPENTGVRTPRLVRGASAKPPPPCGDSPPGSRPPELPRQPGLQSHGGPSARPCRGGRGGGRGGRGERTRLQGLPGPWPQERYFPVLALDCWPQPGGGHAGRRPQFPAAQCSLPC